MASAARASAQFPVGEIRNELSADSDAPGGGYPVLLLHSWQVNTLDNHARRHISLSADEVGILTETLRTAPMESVQTSAGVLGARIHTLSTARVEIRDVAVRAGMVLAVADPFPRFGLALGVAGQTHLQGGLLSSSNLRYLGGRNGVLAQLEPGSRWCNISFDWNLVHHVAETHGYIVPTGDGSVGSPPQTREELVRALSLAARNRRIDHLCDAELEDELMLTFLRALNAGSESRAGRPIRQWRSVHRVIEFIRAEYTKSVTITGLCRAMGVGERTLQYTFRDATGLTVQQYLMNYRLHRARELLQRGECEQIRQVACACGIPHAGRFASYYQRLFGESPRETLATAAAVDNW